MGVIHHDYVWDDRDDLACLDIMVGFGRLCFIMTAYGLRSWWPVDSCLRQLWWLPWLFWVNLQFCLLASLTLLLSRLVFCRLVPFPIDALLTLMLSLNPLRCNAWASFRAVQEFCVQFSSWTLKQEPPIGQALSITMRPKQRVKGYVVRDHPTTPGAEVQFVGPQARQSGRRGFQVGKLYSTMINSLTHSDIKCSQRSSHDHSQSRRRPCISSYISPPTQASHTRSFRGKYIRENSTARANNYQNHRLTANSGMHINYAWTILETLPPIIDTKG